MGKPTMFMNVNVICMLFFAFLIGVIPTSFAEEENDMFVWTRATLDSDYFVHFQAQVRDIDGSLVSVIETFHAEYLSDSRTELVFSQLPLKQVVEISNQKYEVKQFGQIEKDFEIKFDPLDYQQQGYGYTPGVYNLGYEYDGWYTAVFNAYPPIFLVEDDYIVTIQWTILKKI